jgi:[protein-PII] uridylyltransferase
MSETPAPDLKARLARERQNIQALHRNGALGEQVSAALTELYDRVIVRGYQDALERLPAGQRPELLGELAIVAVGGYGRGDLSPYSDVDLLFLRAPGASSRAGETISALVRDYWDMGLKLSQSVRTPAECAAFARRDLAHRTSLTEARLLVGSPALFAELQRRSHRLMASLSINRFIDAVLRERSQEHMDSVASVHLLEPNVKKSPGGLRDVHLLRWIALPRYGTRDPEMLRVGGVILAEDAQTIRTAAEFLYRLRHELHFQAGGAQDLLTREEQERIAAWLGFESQGPLLGVERFMQHYYRQTTALHDLVIRFADGARKRSIFRRVINRLLTERVEESFIVDRETIAIDPSASDEVLKRADVLLRLFDLARQKRVSVAHKTMERIRPAVAHCAITPAALERFRGLISNPDGLGTLVRDLHRIGLLGRFIPAFEHARGLMQFNQYHKFTVDEHSIRALEAVVRRQGDHEGPLGKAYRQTLRKDVLHLAVLLHDIGKGHLADHSEVGKQVAEELGSLLGYAEHERGQLLFLVHRHLFMAHTAFRRDVSDMKTIVQFVRTVGTLETLRMLYLLTAADTEAVAPGEFSSWKESLLTELYLRACEELSGTSPVADEPARAAALREQLRARLGSEFPREWLEAQLGAMPLSYLQRCDPDVVGAHLRSQRSLGASGVKVESGYDRGTGLTEYTVFTRDSLTPGLFSKITGVLAAQRFQIVDAQIVTRADGFVVDTFRGVDTDYSGEPPPHRRTEVASQIEEVLLGRQSVEALFAARRGTTRRNPAPRPSGPTQVEVDNTSSDRFTIVEVFADDRLGLLFLIARTLFELGLSISSAKISTRLDQVVDVFYLTHQSGAKVTEAERLGEMRRRLLDVLGAPLESQATPASR